MAFYDDRNAGAERLILKYGQSMTLKKTNKSSFDNVSGNYNTITVDTEYSITGVKTRYNKDEIDGKTIQRRDFKVITNYQDEIKPTEYYITIGSEDYQIIHVEPVEPASTMVIQKIQVRK